MAAGAVASIGPAFLSVALGIASGTAGAVIKIECSAVEVDTPSSIIAPGVPLSFPEGVDSYAQIVTVQEVGVTTFALSVITTLLRRFTTATGATTAIIATFLSCTIGNTVDTGNPDAVLAHRAFAAGSSAAVWPTLFAEAVRDAVHAGEIQATLAIFAGSADSVAAIIAAFFSVAVRNTDGRTVAVVPIQFGASEVCSPLAIITDAVPQPIFR